MNNEIHMIEVMPWKRVAKTLKSQSSEMPHAEEGMSIEAGARIYDWGFLELNAKRWDFMATYLYWCHLFRWF